MGETEVDLEFLVTPDMPVDELAERLAIAESKLANAEELLTGFTNVGLGDPRAAEVLLSNVRTAARAYFEVA